MDSRLTYPLKDNIDSVQSLVTVAGDVAAAVVVVVTAAIQPLVTVAGDVAAALAAIRMRTCRVLSSAFVTIFAASSARST